MRRQANQRVFIIIALALLLSAGAGVLLRKPLGAVLDYSVRPFTGIFAGIGQRIGRDLDVITRVRDLSARNAQLEHEVAELRKRLSADAEIRVQNEALRRQLNFTHTNTANLLPAAVTGYQPDNYRQFITINRGSRNGLKEGMAVVSEESLVGVISEVSSSSAKVFLITDPNFRVNAIDQQSRASGTVQGQLGNGLVMEKIAQSDTVSVNDTVVTSGVGGTLPKGLIIGRIERVENHDNAVFQSAKLLSSLHFNRLETVFVVTGS